MKRHDREWTWVALAVVLDVLYDVFDGQWAWLVVVTTLFAILTLLFPPPVLRRWLRGSPR